MRAKQTKCSGNSYWSDTFYHIKEVVAVNIDAAESYTEDTPLNLTDIVISKRNTVTVTLTLSNPSAGSLSTGTSGAVTSTFSAGVWTASGATSDVNALLAALTFTPASNFNSNFTISVSVSNGDNPSVVGTKTVTGIAVNDAPSATNLSAPETYTEDSPLNLTDIVVSDVDSGIVAVTLTLSNPSAGSLNTATSGSVTSVFNGSTGVWTAAGVVASVNALLAGLIFTPTSSFHSNFTISTNVSDGVASVTGAKSMTGVALNHAPVLDSSRSPVLNSVAQNASAPSGAVGTQISSLIDAVVPTGGLDNVSDTDGNSIGIALVGADSTNGTWYYSINSGSTWNALGSVSTSSARLLAPAARLYFHPNGVFSGTITGAISFRAWDQTSGTNGSTANTTSNGGSTAFSAATDTANITVT